MADEELLDQVHSLTDLGLAALLCLVAREHCLISTEPDSVDELAEELRLIASKTFNLSSAIISCHAHTTLDEFATGLLYPPPRAAPSPSNTRSVSPYRPRHEPPQASAGAGASVPGSYFPLSPSPRIGGPKSPATATPSNGASGSSSQPSSQPRIANVILAKDLDRAPRAVQIQALELLRTRRIFTRTSVQTAPKQFLFVALVGAASIGDARVTPHLNDFFYIGHWHDPDEDGFPYLDEELGQPRIHADDDDEQQTDDAASTTSSSSVVKVKRHSSYGPIATPSSTAAAATTGLGLTVATDNNPHGWLTHNNSNDTTTPGSNPIHHQQAQDQPYQPPSPSPTPILTPSQIALLSHQTHHQIHTPISLTRYQSNLTSFLRTHRAVAGGISPLATQHLSLLSRSLAALHGLGYVTPSLVGLAVRKVYAHRVVLLKKGEEGRERSVQWGSEEGAVRHVLEGLSENGEGDGVEAVLGEVLGCVGVPV